MTESYNPFRLPFKSRWRASVVEFLLGLPPLAKRYAARPESARGKAAYKGFLRYTLDVLGVGLDTVNPDALSAIPRQGPLVFVANHPLGGLEGVAMTDMLLEIRPDTLVLTNEILTKVPELSQIFIGVDVLSKNAARDNAKGIRAACKHLSQGGAILIYPAGMVSAINVKTRRIEDRQWDKLVGRLVRKYQAHCVPFYVHGRNSWLFYAAGLIHPLLRTVQLPRELANKQGRRFPLVVGQPIAPEEVADLADDQAAANYLRLSCEALAQLEQTDAQASPSAPVMPEFICPPEVSRQINDLGDCRLLSNNGYSVYCAPFDRLGPIMAAIARVREITFRAAGEGTGQELDTDEYDPHYLHLFCWDEQRSAIVGGYRIGRTDEIVQAHGLKGLYSRRHYRFDAPYLQRLGKSLEMGRSFIAPEYQRHPRALDLLWKGIGAYVANNPQYHTLFGCVSISSEHSKLARAFLSESLLESFRAEQDLIMNIRPVVPLKVKGRFWTRETLASVSTIAAINKLLGRCDPGKSIPILLRQYLALNGRFVCFSVNTGFNDSLDGLIIVDLRKTPVKYLNRYLGKEGAKHFLSLWEAHASAA